MKIAGVIFAAVVAVTACPVSPAQSDKRVVAFTIDDVRPFVPVSVNGKVFRFLVDTGAAGHNALALRTATELGLVRRAAGTISGANAGALAVQSAVVERFTMGPIVLRGATFSVADLAPLERRIGFRLDGIVASETLASHRVRFDYPGRVIVVDPSEPLDAPSVPTRIEGGWPVVEAAVDAVPGRFLLDTGDRSYLTLFTPFATAHYPAPQRRLRNVTTGYGLVAPIVTDLTRTRLDVGALNVPELVTRLATQQQGGFASDALAGTIGSGTLLHSVVEIDYRLSSVRIKAAPAQPRSEWDHAGMWLSRDGNALRVDGVVPHGPADEAGIHDGDRLVALNSIPARDVDLPALRARLASFEHSVLTVTRRTRTGDEQLSVKLAPLI
jgi:predicted aspartyl protease